MIDIPVCSIHAGDYPIGDHAISVSSPAHVVTLAASFIAVTAVTNGQFAAFVDAGGYHQSRYWGDMGWRWQQHKQSEYPAFWHALNFNELDQPVVGVCWYEALAFTRWLQEVTGQAWRLPTEAEWEAAARGQSAQITLDTAHINSTEQGIGHPWSAFGRGNVSWCGAYNLLGNVWEWTSSRWGRNWQSLDYGYPYDPNDSREDLSGSNARVMRGGSWFDPLAEAHPANRGRYLPGSRGSNIGFRVARK